MKHKEFKLEKNKIAMANKLQKAKNDKTFCAITIMKSYYVLIGAFAKLNENQGHIVKHLEEGMTGSQIAKHYKVAEYNRYVVPKVFHDKYPKIAVLIDKVIVEKPNDSIK